MKQLALIILAGCTAFLAGCAGADYQRYLEAQTELIKAGQKPILVIKAQPGQQISGLESIEVNAPPSGGAGVANLQPPRNEWANIVRDIGVSAIGGYSGVATTGLIVGGVKSLGDNIERSGTAGYSHIQAPGSVSTSTTTNTVSGTGAIGGGYIATPSTTTTSATTTTNTTDSHAVNGSNNPVTNPVVAAP